MGDIESVGAIRGDLILDDSKWRRSVAQSLKDEARLGTMFRNLRTSLSGLSVSLGIAGGALSGLTAKAVRAAMGVQESENLFEVSMGNMAGATRTWSEQVAKALGMNAAGIRENVGTFNVMLKSMGLGEEAAAGMSRRLTTLSYDLASFYNLKPEEAFAKLRSGISGETEPLKQLGLLINEDAVANFALARGLASSRDALTDTAKVAARFGLIMQSTRLAQGDMARTLGGATNQARSFKEQLLSMTQDLGKTLLPATTALFREMNFGVQIMRSLMAQNPVMTAQFVKAAAGIGAAAIALGTLGFVGPFVVGPVLGVGKALLGVVGLGFSAAKALGGLALTGRG